eukprot:m.246001 g.246001  ORF g.246001 m.246001 type:complete len:246 (+) comp16111_c0_seq2:135-872(+)
MDAEIDNGPKSGLTDDETEPKVEDTESEEETEQSNDDSEQSDDDLEWTDDEIEYDEGLEWTDEETEFSNEYLEVQQQQQQPVELEEETDLSDDEGEGDETELSEEEMGQIEELSDEEFELSDEDIQCHRHDILQLEGPSGNGLNVGTAIDAAGDEYGWEGEVKDGKANGFGIQIWDKRHREILYYGEFKDGKAWGNIVARDRRGMQFQQHKDGKITNEDNYDSSNAAHESIVNKVPHILGCNSIM